MCIMGINVGKEVGCCSMAWPNPAGWDVDFCVFDCVGGYFSGLQRGESVISLDFFLWVWVCEIVIEWCKCV